MEPIFFPEIREIVSEHWTERVIAEKKRRGLPLLTVRQGEDIVNEEWEELLNAKNLIDYIDAVADIAFATAHVCAENNEIQTSVELINHHLKRLQMARVPMRAIFLHIVDCNVAKIQNGVMLDSNGKVMKPSGWVAPEKRIHELLADDGPRVRDIMREYKKILDQQIDQM